VQALPSLQLEPLALGGFEQVPVSGSQVPATWHWSLAVQTIGSPSLHARLPGSQLSTPLQALPSSQFAPTSQQPSSPMGQGGSARTTLEQRSSAKGTTGNTARMIKKL